MVLEQAHAPYVSAEHLDGFMPTVACICKIDAPDLAAAVKNPARME